MIISLRDLFEEALQDEHCLKLNSSTHECRLLYSCKISKDKKTNEVTLENIGKGGDYYKVIDGYHLEVFLEKGWRYGSYLVTLSNCTSKLERIEKLIQAQLDKKLPNAQVIKSHKMLRTIILKKYNTIKSKLNLLNN